MKKIIEADRIIAYIGLFGSLNMINTTNGIFSIIWMGLTILWLVYVIYLTIKIINYESRN